MLHFICNSCDTTLRLYGIGKSKAISKLKTDISFSRQAAVFMKSYSKMEDVIKAEDNAIVSLYSEDPDDVFNTLRLHRFYEKTTSSTAAVEPCVLPPTSAAAKYHSLRVCQQV